jgi:hypothetical protein
MVQVKDHKQRELFDPWDFLSPKRRRMLDESWPGLFKEHLLEELPVREFFTFFDRRFGRPCKEIYTVLGVLLLQQTLALTDEQAVEQLAFNIQRHYALNITSESDATKYISAKTLWTMRRIMIEENLDQSMFEALTEKLSKVFAVVCDRQRLDSVHIKSNMRRLGRIGIFVQTIRKFLVNLKRQYKPLFETIDARVTDRYMAPKQLSAFSMVKPSQSEKTLQQVSADLCDLIERFKGNEAVCRPHSYKLMQRVLFEQCDLKAGGDQEKLTVKVPKQVASDSVQNPSDPDATYSGHKGQGYKVQVMETFTATADDKAPTLNLITHVQVQKACEHDATALMPAIEQSRSRDLCPATLLADTHYGSDENVIAAQGAEVTLVAPVIKGGKDNGKFALWAFGFDDGGKFIACPAGHCPQAVKRKKKRFCVSFTLAQCDVCPKRPKCPVEQGKKGYYLRYDDKAYRLAVRRVMERSDAFIEVYRYRSGVEATMSQFDRRTEVKHLRVRGLTAVRYCATLKAAGINLLRAAAVRSARRRAAEAPKGLHRPLFMPFPFVTERFGRFWARLGAFLLPNRSAVDCYANIAA